MTDMTAAPMPGTLTYARLKEVLVYNPMTGHFFWRVRRGKQRAGSPAGTKFKDGYLMICVDRGHYLAHRLAFLYMTGKFPASFVDHIDRDGWNNAWSNIREATPSENNQNRSIQSNNTSGSPGVVWDGNKKLWKARIGVGGKEKFLGRFKDKYEAVTAYQMAKSVFHPFDVGVA